MVRKIMVSFLFLFFIVVSFVSARSHTGKAKPVKKAVLIVKDSSALETAVSRILVDSLSKVGYTVKEIGLADIGKEYASSYNVSIVFSAVGTGDDIDPSIENFKASVAGKPSKVILYTVWGHIYKKQDKKVDATTEASEEIHPTLIAEQILRSLNL